MGQAVRDIYSGTEKERQEVILWTNSPDFVTVCDYADVEPGSMREEITNLFQLSPALAKKYGQILRMGIVYETP